MKWIRFFEKTNCDKKERNSFIKDKMDKKEILYPNLLHTCKYTTSSFWYNLFENLAYGRPPSRLFITNHHLSCTRPGVEFSFNLRSEMEYSALHAHLFSLLNREEVLSPNEHSLILIEKEMSEISEEVTNKKISKTILLEKFVIEIEKQFSFGLKKARYILIALVIAFLFKTLKQSDLVFESHEGDQNNHPRTKIKSISGFECSSRGEVSFLTSEEDDERRHNEDDQGGEDRGEDQGEDASNSREICLLEMGCVVGSRQICDIWSKHDTNMRKYFHV